MEQETRLRGIRPAARQLKDSDDIVPVLHRYAHCLQHCVHPLPTACDELIQAIIETDAFPHLKAGLAQALTNNLGIQGEVLLEKPAGTDYQWPTILCQVAMLAEMVTQNPVLSPLN